MDKWKIRQQEYVLKSNYLTVRKDCITTSKGVEIDDFYVLEYPNWINVIAINEQGLFILEKQYRHGIQKVGWEICAGMIENGETPLQAAQRELLEETGYGEGEWTMFLESTPNPCSMTNANYTFLANNVKRIALPQRDSTEDIEVQLVDRNHLHDILSQGLISEGIMQAPLWKYFALELNKD